VLLTSCLEWTIGEDNKQSCTLDVIHQKVRNFFNREMAILFPVKREMAILFFVKRDLDPPFTTLIKMGHWKISFAQRDKNLNNQVSKVQIPKIELGEC